jgi:hypothetical protein
VEEGTDGIVIVGTTGESATVDPEEHGELIKLAVDHVAGRIPVIAGSGGNSTAEAIALTRAAQGSRRRRLAAGGAVLQPSDPGRHVPPLQGDRRSGRPAGHPVQRAGPYRCRHEQRDHRCAWRRSPISSA